MVNHYLVNKFSGSGGITSVCQVISRYHVIKESCGFMGGKP